jgi:hypothetical protein
VCVNHGSNLGFEGMEFKGWIIPAVGIAQPCSKWEEMVYWVNNGLSKLGIQRFHLFGYNSLRHYLGYYYGYSGYSHYCLLYMGPAVLRFLGYRTEFPANLSQVYRQPIIASVVVVVAISFIVGCSYPAMPTL